MWQLSIGAVLAFFCGEAFADPISTAFAAVTSALGTAGTSAAVSALSSVAASKLLGGSGAPKIKKPTAMPTPDDEAVKAAKRRQIAETQARSGRASTILSDDGAKLGG